MAKKKNAASTPAPMEAHRPPPSIRITGEQAKKLSSVKPGQRVTFTVTGKLMESGISEYDRDPHCRIEVARISRKSSRKKG